VTLATVSQKPISGSVVPSSHPQPQPPAPPHYKRPILVLGLRFLATRATSATLRPLIQTSAVQEADGQLDHVVYTTGEALSITLLEKATLEKIQQAGRSGSMHRSL